MRLEMSCGHEVEALERDKESEPPNPPRMCPTCQKMRDVVGPADDASSAPLILLFLG